MSLSEEKLKEYRLGNENLIRATPEAALKISELKEREKAGDFLKIRITGGGVMDFLIR